MANEQAKNKSYDAVVIGGGPGGYVCGIRLGQLKQKVLVVEKDEVGGVCLNWGCVPSKALIATSHTYEKVKEGANIGLMIDGLRLDVNKLQDWKAGIVKKLTTGVRGLLKGNTAELMMGDACVTSPTQVVVKTREGGTEPTSSPGSAQPGLSALPALSSRSGSRTGSPPSGFGRYRLPEIINFNDS